jgi:hypothetical protein
MVHDADDATFLAFFTQEARCCRASSAQRPTIHATVNWMRRENL